MKKLLFILKLTSGSLNRLMIHRKNIFYEMYYYCLKYWNLQFKSLGKSNAKYKIYVAYHYFKIIYYKPAIPFSKLIDIVPRRVQDYLLPIINKDKKLMVDKVEFYKKLNTFRITFPAVFFYIKDHEFSYIDIYRDCKVESEYLDSAFAKKYDGSAGKGAFLVKNKKIKDLPTGYIYQEIQKNHPLIYTLADNNVLNTIRIHSYKCENNDIELQSAHIKLSNGNITDNIGTGGIGVAIDVKTGRLHKEGFAEIGKKKVFKKHPLGTVNFQDFILPYWQETVNLVYELHFIFDEIRSVGWDIAITETGPSVVEGNAGGDIFIPQVFIEPFYNSRMIQENLIN